MKNNITPNKAPATIHLTTTLATDGYVEVTVDVAGGYVFRDRLKSAEFKFVRDQNGSIDAKTGKRKPAVWRRIIVAIPPDVSEDRAIKGLNLALDELDELLAGMLEGSHVKGAKPAAEALRQHWNSSDAINPIASRLAGLDTPWDNSVQRPPFAA